jgi:hypothetical protein
MASKTTLNASNLQILGAEALAELLMEISTGSAAAKARLRLALAGAQSPEVLKAEVVKRMQAVERARGKIHWRRRRALALDLENQRRAISGPIAAHDPVAAVGLLFRFLDLSNRVLARCEDTTGVLAAQFAAAADDIGEAALAAKMAPEALEADTAHAVSADLYGATDGLIAKVAPALGAKGLALLKARFQGYAAEAPKPTSTRLMVMTSKGRFVPAGTLESPAARLARGVLEAIADLQGDVDGFIALQLQDRLRTPDVSFAIAQRLFAAGRAAAALETLERTDMTPGEVTEGAYGALKIEILDALGETARAQAARLAVFRLSLEPADLRAYLRRLPDFDDAEAEEAILTDVSAMKDVHAALAFLTAWPALRRAADLVRAKTYKIDGDDIERLEPAADILAARHPLEATILWRSMIEAALRKSRSGRYAAMARRLEDCRAAAARIEDFGSLGSHEAFLSRLKASYGRKASFWENVLP